MGLITTFIALLNVIFRTIEYLSIKLFHTGKFSNTDKKICRSCLISGKRNWDLCTDDRLVWLLDLEYPEGLYVWLNAVGGVSFVLLGMAGMWCNYLDGWWKFSEGFDGVSFVSLF